MARTFGARFLEEFKREGGSTAAWSPQALEAVINADRCRFIAALEKVSPEAAKALTIATNLVEPEELARRAVSQMQRADPGGADGGGGDSGMVDPIWVDHSPSYTSE